MKKILFLLGMIISCSLFAAQDHFYFIQVTDTHFGFEENLTKKQQARHFDKLKSFVDEINSIEIKPEFIVFTGDIENEHPIAKESFDKSMEIIRKIKYPVYYLPGNHDINPDKVDSMEQSKSDFIKNFNELSFVKEINGVKFIFLYNETMRKNIQLKDYDGEKWLKEVLTTNNEKPAIVFIHSPPVETFYEGKFSGTWNTENSMRFVELLSKNSVKALIAGHVHSANSTYAGDVPVYTAPSFIDFDGGTYSYRIFEYNKGKISYFTQEIN